MAHIYMSRKKDMHLKLQVLFESIPLGVDFFAAECHYFLE